MFSLKQKYFCDKKKRYPMELHAVHFNTKFGSSMVEALNNSGKAYNTLAVLAVMFEVQEEDNPMLKPIVDG
jgi:carbonic anhydrase